MVESKARKTAFLREAVRTLALRPMSWLRPRDLKKLRRKPLKTAQLGSPFGQLQVDGALFASARQLLVPEPTVAVPVRDWLIYACPTISESSGANQRPLVRATGL